MDGELVDGHLKKQKYKGRNGFEVLKKKYPYLNVIELKT